MHPASNKGMSVSTWSWRNPEWEQFCGSALRAEDTLHKSDMGGHRCMRLDESCLGQLWTLLGSISRFLPTAAVGENQHEIRFYLKRPLDCTSVYSPVWNLSFYWFIFKFINFILLCSSPSELKHLLHPPELTFFIWFLLRPVFFGLSFSFISRVSLTAQWNV